MWREGILAKHVSDAISQALLCLQAVGPAEDSRYTLISQLLSDIVEPKTTYGEPLYAAYDFLTSKGELVTKGSKFLSLTLSDEKGRMFVRVSTPAPRSPSLTGCEKVPSPTFGEDIWIYPQVLRP